MDDWELTEKRRGPVKGLFDPEYTEMSSEACFQHGRSCEEDSRGPALTDHDQLRERLGLLQMHRDKMRADAAEWYCLALKKRWREVLSGLKPKLVNDPDVAKMQLRLGRLHLEAGVMQDFVMARMWIGLAEPGLTGDLREHATKLLDEISRKLDPGQIRDAERMAVKWNLLFHWANNRSGESIPKTPSAISSKEIVEAKHPAVGPTEFEELLEDLERLKARGILSEEEFQRAKEKLLIPATRFPPLYDDH